MNRIERDFGYHMKSSFGNANMAGIHQALQTVSNVSFNLLHHIRHPIRPFDKQSRLLEALVSNRLVPHSDNVVLPLGGYVQKCRSSLRCFKNESIGQEKPGDITNFELASNFGNYNVSGLRD